MSVKFIVGLSALQLELWLDDEALPRDRDSANDLGLQPSRATLAQGWLLLGPLSDVQDNDDAADDRAHWAW